MLQAIRNKEFRDYAGTVKYPFSDLAGMTAVDGFLFPDDVVLDMVACVGSDLRPPLRVSSLSLGESSTIALVDALGVPACSATLSPGGSSADLVDKFGRGAGTIVWSPSGLERLRAMAGDVTMSFGEEALPLAASRVFVYASDFLSVVTAGDDASGTSSALSGEVVLVAAAGVKFVVDDDGTVSFNLLGEEPETGMPVASVNGSAMSHLWLDALPLSEIKVLNEGESLAVKGMKDVG